MSRLHQLFVATAILLFLIFNQTELISGSGQLILSSALILGLGIPHGAIDHVLFSKTQKLPNWLFFAFYLGTMTLYLIAWVYHPVLCLGFFLFISAYHFGQSQFIQYFNSETFFYKIFYFCWGTSILSGLFYFNHEELITLLTLKEDTTVFTTLFHKELLSLILVLSSIITLIFFVYLRLKNLLSYKQIIEETLIYISIQSAFFLLPLILSFTLYFVVMHSLKVMAHEFYFLKKSGTIRNIKNFISLLLPFSLLSVVMLGIFSALHFFNIIHLSFSLMIFILISLITLPHSIIMDKFYEKARFKFN